MRDHGDAQSGLVSGRRLRDLVKSFDLVGICQNLHPDSIVFTFMRPGVGVPRIDRLYISWVYASVVPVASTQQYVRESMKRQKSRIGDLEKEVFDLESCLGQLDMDLVLQGVYKEKKAALQDLQLDLDRSSPFFHSLEKRRDIHQQLLVLLANDRSLISNPEGFRAQIHTYYSALFCPDSSSEDACRALWEDLLQLIPEDAGRLDAPVTFEELTGAPTQLPRGRSPGLEKLTMEFFRVFWDILGGDYAQVLGVHQGCPLSCQLYSLYTEPFLCILWRRLLGLVLRGLGMGVVFPVYADDTFLTFTNLADLGRMRESRVVYLASSTRVNWAKCSRPLVSLYSVPWGAGRLDDLLLGLLLSLAKLAINRSRQQATEGSFTLTACPSSAAIFELRC
eukprot:g39688.t1